MDVSPPARTSLTIAVVLQLVLVVLTSGLLGLLAVFLDGFSRQMPGIHPAVPIVAGVVGALNLALLVPQGWAWMRARRVGSRAAVRVAAWVTLGVAGAEALVLLVGFGVIGCPVLPVLMLPSAILAGVALRGAWGDAPAEPYS